MKQFMMDLTQSDFVLDFILCFLIKLVLFPQSPTEPGKPIGFYGVKFF